jgi:hypothetical protein
VSEDPDGGVKGTQLNVEPSTAYTCGVWVRKGVTVERVHCMVIFRHRGHRHLESQVM